MLFTLSYGSVPTIGAHSTEMLDIARVSLRRNGAMGVTGALYYSDRAFFQVLEGGEDAVRAIYASIERDPRHECVTLLEAVALPARRFGGWAMRFCDGSDHPHLRALLEEPAAADDERSALVRRRIEALLAP